MTRPLGVPERRAVYGALKGHEGVVWVQSHGRWECRCGSELTEPMTPARPDDALEPWRAHIALLLCEVES